MKRTTVDQDYVSFIYKNNSKMKSYIFKKANTSVRDFQVEYAHIRACSCQSLIPMRLLICMHGSAVGTGWAGVRWVGWSVGCCCHELLTALTAPPRIIRTALFPSLSLISLIKCESLRLFVSLSL